MANPYKTASGMPPRRTAGVPGASMEQRRVRPAVVRPKAKKTMTSGATARGGRPGIPANMEPMEQRGPGVNNRMAGVPASNPNNPYTKWSTAPMEQRGPTATPPSGGQPAGAAESMEQRGPSPVGTTAEAPVGNAGNPALNTSAEWPWPSNPNKKYPGHGKYIQTPQQQEIWEKWGRTMLGRIFGTDKNPMDPNNLYKIPELEYNVPKYKGVDINQYIPGGQVYKNVENKIAPSLWQSYDRNVQNPMISRFAGGGQLGNPSAGLSGAAADVLEANRRQAGNDISAQAYNLAQNPLMKAFDADTQGRQLQYGLEGDKARQQALLPWQANLERNQYPYKLIPGMLNIGQQTPIYEQKAPDSGGKC